MYFFLFNYNVFENKFILLYCCFSGEFQTPCRCLTDWFYLCKKKQFDTHVRAGCY